MSVIATIDATSFELDGLDAFAKALTLFLDVCTRPDVKSVLITQNPVDGSDTTSYEIRNVSSGQTLRTMVVDRLSSSRVNFHIDSLPAVIE